MLCALFVSRKASGGKSHDLSRLLEESWYLRTRLASGILKSTPFGERLAAH